MRTARQCALALLIVVGAPASARDAQQDDTQLPGQTASSMVGRAGQRQETNGLLPNDAPLARIESRIPNRVQSRLHTRVDRLYNPSMRTVTGFEESEAQVRTSGRPRRR